MVTPKIEDVDIIEIPKNGKSDMQRFIDGFRQLAEICNMNRGNGFKYIFDNGSELGTLALLKEIWHK